MVWVSAGPVICWSLSQFFCYFTPAHLVGGSNCSSKGFCLGLHPNPSTGSLSWLQEKASSGSISPIVRSLNDMEILSDKCQSG